MSFVVVPAPLPRAATRLLLAAGRRAPARRLPPRFAGRSIPRAAPRLVACSTPRLAGRLAGRLAPRPGLGSALRPLREGADVAPTGSAALPRARVGLACSFRSAV